MKKYLYKRTKAIQKAFNNKKLIYSIIQKSKNDVDLRWNFGAFFRFYFGNRNGKPMEERYYFQAFNGCYGESFNENGLGDISGLDSMLVEAFKLLEDELGTSNMSFAGENNGEFRNFLTTDPFMLMKFALIYSPERLWLGPLGVDIVEGLKFPYKVGETKNQYMIRLLESRIPENINNERRNKIMKAGKIICNEFGSKRPKIAIIPESEIGEYDADFLGIHKYCQTNLFELANKENKYWVLDMQSGPNFSSSQGVCVYGKITPDKFATITIPDIFEIIQIMAIEKGAEFGDLVDPQNGNIIEKSKVEVLPQVEVKKQNYDPKKLPEITDISFEDNDKPSLTELSKTYQDMLAQTTSNNQGIAEDKLIEGEDNSEI